MRSIPRSRCDCCGLRTYLTRNRREEHDQVPICCTRSKTTSTARSPSPRTRPSINGFNNAGRWRETFPSHNFIVRFHHGGRAEMICGTIIATVRQGFNLPHHPQLWPPGFLDPVLGCGQNPGRSQAGITRFIDQPPPRQMHRLAEFRPNGGRAPSILGVYRQWLLMLPLAHTAA